MRKPKLVSLFAGIGGFELGFEREGFEVAAHVEIDKHCRKVLNDRWPDVACPEDVREAGGHNLPRCDVVTYGFPCQDLSVAGKRKGLEGKRSGLFYEAMRIIDELQPAWAIWENVPGLLTSDGGRDLARVLFSMAEHGYSGCYRVLDSQWFGVAQRRRRVFGVFARGESGAERAAKVLSIAVGLRGHSTPRRPSGEGAAVYAEGSFGGWREGCGTLRASGGYAGGGSESLVVSPAVRSEPVYFERRFVRTHAGAPRRDGTSNALTAGHGGTGDGAPHIAGGGYGVRKLTPLECERLQGFPDGWTDGLSDAQRYKALGNAVTVNVVRWIAKRLRKQIERELDYDCVFR